MNDPFVGKLAFFRVYSGTLDSRYLRLQLHKGSRRNVLDVSCRCTQTTERKSTEFTPVISRQQSVLRFTTTGDTLCDEDHEVILESMVFPEPVISVAIEPKTKAGQ